MSFGINHERTLDDHRGPAYGYRFDYESPIKVRLHVGLRSFCTVLGADLGFVP